MSEQNQGCYITSELAKCPNEHNAICMLASPDPGKIKPLINVCKFFNDLKLCKLRGAMLYSSVTHIFR